MIEIDDATSGKKLTGETTPVVIGRHVRLRVKVVQPPGGALTEIRWAIPGQSVKSYGAPASSAIVQLSDADLAAEQLAYYWIAGAAQPLAVTVQAKVNGGSATSEADFRLDAPTPTTLSSVTERVRVGHTAYYTQSEALSFGIGFTQNPGIRWTFRAHAPENGGGEIAGVQLINLVECVQSLPDSPERCDGTAGYALDGSFFYASSRVRIRANGDATWSSDDSPQSRLTERPAVVVRRDDRFHTYLVYRPSGTDSIWVTLGRLDWSWAGAAHRIAPDPDPQQNGNGQNAGQRERPRWAGPFDPRWAVNPPGAASSELPQWTRIFGNEGH